MPLGYTDEAGVDSRSPSSDFLVGRSKDRNLYVFVLNDPIQLVDALGLMASRPAHQTVVVVIYETRVDSGADTQTADTLRVLSRMDRQLEWELTRGSLPSGASPGEQPSRLHNGKCYRHVYFVDAELSGSGGVFPLGYGNGFEAIVFAERTKRNFDSLDLRGVLDPRVSALGRDTAYSRIGGFMLAHEVLHSVGASHQGDDRFVMTRVPTWMWIFRWPFVSQQTVNQVKRALDVP